MDKMLALPANRRSLIGPFRLCLLLALLALLGLQSLRGPDMRTPPAPQAPAGR